MDKFTVDSSAALSQQAESKCSTCNDVGNVGHSMICPGCEDTWTPSDEQAEPAPAQDEQEAFEAKFPMPEHCMKCGDSYAATEFHAWGAHKYINLREGWMAALKWHASRPAQIDKKDRMAIKMLVAAGYVTEEKANDALCIANGFSSGELSPAQTEQQPIGVTAVAVTRENDDGELYLDWLLEGGICELEIAGQVLVWADQSITDDEGRGEIYAAPIAQTAPQPEQSADMVLNPEAQKVLTDCIGAHAYIVGTITSGRPDLALIEACKWVESFREASAAVSAQGGE